MNELLSLNIGGMPAWGLLLALPAVLVAGYIRGFSGFGFALAAVPALTLLGDPDEVVPTVTLLGFLANLELLPRVRRSIDWHSVSWLVPGAVLGTPLGVWCLAVVPADLMRAAIGLSVLTAVLLLGTNFRFARTPGIAARLGVSTLSGLLGGGLAMSGPPVIIFYLASPLSAAVGRASLMAFFLFQTAGSIALFGASGLIDGQTLLLSALLYPALFIGNRLGARSFDRAQPGFYRRIVLIVLSAIALVALGRAGAGIAD